VPTLAEPTLDDFDLKFTAEGDPIVVHVGRPKRTVVGYLSYDPDCPDPIENCDGMGKLLRGSAEVQQALGLDSNGESDLESYMGEAEKKVRFSVRALDPIISEKEIDVRMEQLEDQGRKIREVAAGLWLKHLDPLLVILDYHDYGSGGSKYSVDCLATDYDWSQGSYRANGLWVADPAVKDHIEYTAMLAQMPEGTDVSYKSQSNPDGTCITRPPNPGEKSYFKDGTCIDEHHHNVITYTTPSGREQGGFKSFPAAIEAAAEAMGVAFDRKRYLADCQKEALKCAGQAVEEWNRYANGDCWGCCVEVFDDSGALVSDDAVWGHVGLDWAEQALAEEIKRTVESIKKDRKKIKHEHLQHPHETLVPFVSAWTRLMPHVTVVLPHEHRQFHR
jgi:hypothetical protein